MDSAISIYRAVGFQTIAPYDEHPFDGTIYMERDLTAGFSFASATAVRNALKRLVKLNDSHE
jgi:hypothetical protein